MVPEVGRRIVLVTPVPNYDPPWEATSAEDAPTPVGCFSSMLLHQGGKCYSLKSTHPGGITRTEPNIKTCEPLEHVSGIRVSLGRNQSNPHVESLFLLFPQVNFNVPGSVVMRHPTPVGKSAAAKKEELITAVIDSFPNAGDIDAVPARVSKLTPSTKANVDCLILTSS